MTKQEIEQALTAKVDALAAIEHERWSKWQRYVHEKGALQPDGSLLIPADLVERWESQIARTFSELSESEKDSDREQVRRYLQTIAEALIQ